ncbi:hypothetical protein L1047_01040 [Synechococcus sp. Nb3U1]|uniref:hypothetical protein n=1 Tax=Synechococcus sp. Nb3U1 TaxID=1914529 RepID=UPI001F184ED6|nr:hypothetical protein [Synechococcus sp. Nb3U1]MCF2969781.1 hypothetical protein [Synechococcus sp. Nb3U1]
MVSTATGAGIQSPEDLGRELQKLVQPLFSRLSVSQGKLHLMVEYPAEPPFDRVPLLLKLGTYIRSRPPLPGLDQVIIYGRVSGQILPQWQKVFRISPEGTSHSDATQVLMPGVPPSRSRSTANSQSREQTLPAPLCIQELVLGDTSVDAEVPTPSNLPAAFGAAGAPQPSASVLPQAPTQTAPGWIWKATVAALAVAGIGLGAYFLWPRTSESEPAAVVPPPTLSN